MRPPPTPPKWQQQQLRQPAKKKKKIWERVFVAVVEALGERRAWFFELGTAVMCLVVGDGALWLSGVGEEREEEKRGGGDDVWRGRAVRVLATFVFLGMVEPVWRNVSFSSSFWSFPDYGIVVSLTAFCANVDGTKGEKGRKMGKGNASYTSPIYMYVRMLMKRGRGEQRADLQMRDLGVCTRGASCAGFEDKLISLVTTGSVIEITAITSTAAIFAWTGEWLDVLERWFPADMKPHQVFVMLWLLSPFTDLAETVSLAFFSI